MSVDMAPAIPSTNLLSKLGQQQTLAKCEEDDTLLNGTVYFSNCKESSLGSFNF